MAVVISSGTPSPSRSPSPTAGTPVAVPSVVTMPRAPAEQLLTNDGFVVAAKTARARWARAIVYDQSPKGGAARAGQHGHHLGHASSAAAARDRGRRGGADWAGGLARPAAPPAAFQALAMKIT